MKNIRILLTTPVDVQAVKECQAMTGETTAAKAILEATRRYPATAEELATVKAQLADTTAKVDALTFALEAMLFGEGGSAGLDARIKTEVDAALARRRTRRTPAKTTAKAPRKTMRSPKKA